MIRIRPSLLRLGTIPDSVIHYAVSGSVMRIPLILCGLVISAFAVALLANFELGENLFLVGLPCVLSYMAAHSDLPRWWAARRSNKTVLNGPFGGMRSILSPHFFDSRGRSASDVRSPSDEISRGIAVLDGDRRVVWCNDQGAEHFGIHKVFDIGRSIASITEMPQFVEHLLKVHDNSNPSPTHTHQDGDKTICVQLVPYINSGWLLLSHDVTKATGLETMKSDCVANTLHELSTPLTLIIGYCEALQEFETAGSARNLLDLLDGQCQRARLLVKDLLRLSVLESTPNPPEDAQVSVGILLSRIRSEVETLSAGRHTVVLDAQPGFDLLGTDHEITSIFSNLARNAVRYTPAGGDIRLTWRATPKGAAFTVEDTGIGIERKHISRLTERFYRVDRHARGEMGGTGLGLAITKQALVRHQATLKIESEPGRGSRFTAAFPASRVVSTKMPEQAAA